MIARVLAVAVLATLAAGCPRKDPDSTTPPVPVALTREDRLQIARLEVQREAGVTRLVELARDQHAGRRGLAIRALGRVGGPTAIRALRAALGGPDAVAAAAALGVAGATGVLEPDDAAAIAGELAKVTASGDARATVVEALGRLGHAAALPALASAIGSDDPAVASAAGVALGRLGRTKVALDDTTEMAVIGRSKDDDAGVRYAATYALARAFVDPASPPPAATDQVVRALRDRLTDDDAVTRAAAVSGLGARRAVPVTTPALLDRLDDTDWRVAVELVRVLGGRVGHRRDQEGAGGVPRPGRRRVGRRPAAAAVRPRPARGPAPAPRARRRSQDPHPPGHDRPQLRRRAAAPARVAAPAGVGVGQLPGAGGAGAAAAGGGRRRCPR